MAPLQPGSNAPRFSLADLDGKQISFAADRNVVLAFFKVSCPTCQYTFPYLERLYQHKIKGNGSAIQLIGISQDDQRATREFVHRFGVTFPVLLDTVPGYPASNAYGLANVPSIFLVGSDGKISFTSIGWSRDDMEDLNARISTLTDATLVPLFRSGDNVVQFKAG